jgi:uncharacterized protein YaiL (DUF2058 family)
MSDSLRDQLLKAGLINKKQAQDAERQAQRNERPQSAKHKPKPGQPAAPPKVDAAVVAARAAQSAKVARDQALNRRQQEKADKKARAAQIKQWVNEQRLAPLETGEAYNFVDGPKIRRVMVTPAIRAQIGRRELAIVRNEGGYDLVPAALAARIRERDPNAFIFIGGADGPPADDAYSQFTVPDDLIW